MLHQPKAPMYIRTAAPLRRLCSQAQAEGRFALDLEFIRENSYVPRLALIQIAVSDTCAIVDPLLQQQGVVQCGTPITTPPNAPSALALN